MLIKSYVQRVRSKPNNYSTSVLLQYSIEVNVYQKSGKPLVNLLNNILQGQFKFLQGAGYTEIQQQMVLVVNCLLYIVHINKRLCQLYSVHCTLSCRLYTSITDGTSCITIHIRKMVLVVWIYFLQDFISCDLIS